MLIGSANVLVIIVIVVTFFRVKGVANCLDICLGVVRKRHRVVSQAVSQRVTDLIDRMGGEAVVAARKKVRERSVEQGMESPSVVMFDNPSANIELQNYMSQKQSRDDDAQEEDSTPSMPTHGAPGMRQVAEATAASLRLLDPDFYTTDLSLEAELVVGISSMQTSTRYSRKFGAEHPSPELIRKAEAARAAIEKSLEDVRADPTPQTFALLVSDIASNACVGSFFNPHKVQANRRRAAAAAPHLTEKGRKLYCSRNCTSAQRAAMCSSDKATAEAAEAQVKLEVGVPRELRLLLRSTEPAVRQAAEADAKRVRGLPKALQLRLLSADANVRQAAEADAKRLPSKTAAATAAASKSADLKRTANPSSDNARNAKKRKQRAEASAAAAASGNSKPCVCSTCGKGYAALESLRRHARQKNHELI